MRPRKRVIAAIAAVVLLAAACSTRGQNREEAIDSLVDDGLMTEAQAICYVDALEARLEVQLEDIVDDDDLSDEDMVIIGEIVDECILGLPAGGDTGSTDTGSTDTGGTDTTEAPMETTPTSDSGGDTSGTADGGSDTSTPDFRTDPVGAFDPSDPPPGTDSTLDALWVSCGEGSASACDDLFFDSPVDSDYEAFGFSCGGREVTVCDTILGGDAGAQPPGDDAALDALWLSCADGSAAACDDLYLTAPAESAYFNFGFSCGGGEPDLCTDVLGDDGPPSALANWDPSDPAPGEDSFLDGLWTQCGSGSGQACGDLYGTSEIGSEYERFGFTCGGRAIANCLTLLGDSQSS
jgi:hypothetical protein